MTAAPVPTTGGDAEFYDWDPVAGKFLRRGWLSRWWGNPARRVLLIGLNPSFADADTADLTTTKNVAFAKLWGFGALDMVNLFDWIATDPTELAKAPDPQGDPRNLAFIEGLAFKAERIVTCWGDGGHLHGRAAYVLSVLWGHRARMFCLGRTKGGYPKHTSRLAYETELQRMVMG